MKIVEINTTQNVVIQYECASLQERIFAFLIDSVSVGVAFGLLRLIFAVTGLGFMEYVISLFMLFYTLICENLMNGQTLGKKAMSIRVINLKGEKPFFTDLAARWAFRLVDIYLSIGSVASLMIGSSAKGQRIGDLVANTIVIKTKASRHVALADIMKIHSVGSYTPVYPEVKRLAEEDMLLIKTTLERNRLFRNRSHDHAMDELCERLGQLLGLDEVPADRNTFLSTLINDYVVLTR